jgi:hypothetical protein
MFIVRTEDASLFAASPNPSRTLAFCFYWGWNARIRSDYCMYISLRYLWKAIKRTGLTLMLVVWIQWFKNGFIIQTSVSVAVRRFIYHGGVVSCAVHPFTANSFRCDSSVTLRSPITIHHRTANSDEHSEGPGPQAGSSPFSTVPPSTITSYHVASNSSLRIPLSLVGESI